jgi:NACHT domain
MAGGTKQAGFVAWLVTFVLPPAVAGGLGQRFVAHHPGWTVIVGVAYEALVAVAWFFAVIARDVSSRWQVRLADRIDLFLQRKTSSFERQYREFVLRGLRFMDHKGLATVGPFTPELDAVFVNVTLVSRPPQQIGPGVLPTLSHERAGRRVLSDFIGREEPVVLAVVGSPGSGKTTLLRHTARQVCLRNRVRHDGRSPLRDIPILLYLRDHADAITADPTVSVGGLLRTTLGAIGAEESPGWFEQQLRDGRCLVLLDGLDEVSHQEDRAKVSAWAEAQVRQYPGNDFVISSRPKGYQSAPVEGAAILEVCGFTSGQAETFVQGWYRSVERLSTGSAGSEVEELAAKGANDLLRRLAQTPALYDLTVNPLLLTMIANVHRYRGALPGTRADLYAEICQVMLWRRQDAKHLSQPIGGDKKEAILRGLAFTMMKGRVSDLNRANVLTAIQPALRRMSDSVTPDGFLADVSSDGLLIERETGQYAFAHQTLQEYLAAAHIRENGLVNELARSVGDDWWAETTMLFAAKSNADPIVQACLRANSATALALALDCTEQDNDVDPDLRRRVNELIVSATAPDADQERRRLFAAILLTRHMRQRERTVADVQVGARPIPSEIYQLFLVDTRTPEPDAPAAESEIAVGMRSSDADAFVRWTISLPGGRQSYRLPKAAELTQLAVRNRAPAFPDGRLCCPWTQGDTASPDSLPVLWLPPQTQDPYVIENVALTEGSELEAARSGFTLSGLLLWSRLQMHALDLARKGFLVRALPLARDLDFARAVDRDLDIARALARALALDRALDLDRDLALVHDLAFGLTVAGGRARALDLALARDLTRHLARDLDAAQALDRALDLARVRVRDLARDLADARVGDLARAQVIDDPHVLIDIDLDQELESAFEGGLQLALTHALDLAAAIDKTVNNYLASTPVDGLSQPILDATCRFFVGQAFSNAIIEGLRSHDPSNRGSAQFAAANIDATGTRKAARLTANPATMEATLQDAVTKLTELLSKELADLPEAASWRSAVADRLRHKAGPVFARAERPTLATTVATKTAALCLAAEADGMGREDIGDQFRQLTAGISLLQRRAMDERLAIEVIMLAAE